VNSRPLRLPSRLDVRPATPFGIYPSLRGLWQISSILHGRWKRVSLKCSCFVVIQFGEGETRRLLPGAYCRSETALVKKFSHSHMDFGEPHRKLRGPTVQRFRVLFFGRMGQTSPPHHSYIDFHSSPSLPLPGAGIAAPVIQFTPLGGIAVRA